MKSKSPTRIEGLEVVPLGRFEWRVSDGSGSRELLGYIERQRAGRFEVVWMTDPMRWGYAASFEDAVLAFGDSIRFTGEIFAQRAEDVGADRAGLGFFGRVPLPRRSTWIKSTGRSSVA